MKTGFLILKVILAIALITLGADNLSEPSNIAVAFGLIEIILGLILLYAPVRSLFKHI